MIRNILYVFPQFAIGGAEKASILISNELKIRYNYQPSFFFFDRGRKIDDWSDRISDPILFESHVSTAISWIDKLRIPFRIVKEIKNCNIDCVVSGYEYDVEVVLIITRLFLLNKRVRFITILQASINGRKSETSLKRKLLFKMVDLLRCYVFKRIIVVSAYIKDELFRTCSKKIAIIPNPLDNSIDHLQYEEIFPLPHEIKNNPFILNVSRISSQKNLLLLLQSFSIIKEKIPHNLVIIGNVSSYIYYREIKNYILENKLEKRVFILTPRKNIYPLIRKADLIAFTSFYEGLPLFILEAMYMRKLIVSTKFSGYNSLLTEKNSLLCSSFQARDFSDLLLWAVSSKNNYIEMTEFAYKDSLSFCASNVAEQYHYLLSKL